MGGLAKNFPSWAIPGAQMAKATIMEKVAVLNIVLENKVAEHVAQLLKDVADAESKGELSRTRLSDQVTTAKEVLDIGE